jgi:hypothetical protein
VTDLANRPYWSRYWIIQEFLLAPEVHIFCSDNVMQWLDFKDMIGRYAGSTIYGSISNSVKTSDSSRELFAAWPLLENRHVDRFPELY